MGSESPGRVSTAQIASVAPPRFRGVSHLLGLAVASPVGVALGLHARSGSARLGAIVFAASVVAMFGASSLFHRVAWQASRKRWICLLDHSMIYALIAGTYTPFALIVLRPDWRAPVLLVVWGAALGGAIAKFRWPAAPAWVTAATCVALGWVSVIVFPQIVGRIGYGGASLLVAGGLAYTVGAAIYARRRPDPFPRTFGYHEIFHSLVIVAVICQYATIAFFVLPRA
ncbi:MAG TPA: hemolysin III family protein [Gaiellaceae bacterium]|nr:hemolysin III family protein [Gaiellaceae bacterium]